MIHEHFSAAFSYTGQTPEITAALRAMKQVLFTVAEPVFHCNLSSTLEEGCFKRVRTSIGLIALLTY